MPGDILPFITINGAKVLIVNKLKDIIKETCIALGAIVKKGTF